MSKSRVKAIIGSTVQAIQALRATKEVIHLPERLWYTVQCLREKKTDLIKTASYGFITERREAPRDNVCLRRLVDIGLSRGDRRHGAA